MNVISVEQVMQSPVIQVPGVRHSKRMHFHVSYSDYRDICDGDTANADALRVLEWQLTERAKRMQKQGLIPLGHLPHVDDSWIEASGNDFERETNGENSRSTYSSRCLADKAPASKSKKKIAPRSLIQLGYAQKRIVARPKTADGFDQPKTAIYEDENGPFILVLNKNGDYLGDDGKQHNARVEGFVTIAYQYNPQLDAVNTAIAVMDCVDPPKTLPRWTESVTVRKWRSGDPPPSAKRSEAVLTPIEPASLAADASYQASTKTYRGAQGVCSTSMKELSGSNDTRVLRVSATLSDPNSPNSQKPTVEFVPPSKRTQLHRDTIDAEAKQSAKWTPETIIDLLSLILDIPARESVDAKWWREKIEEPAEWIYEHAEHPAGLRYLWEDLYRRATFTLNGAFWKKSCPRPMPTNLVGRDKIAKQLNGWNWKTMPGDMDKESWNPAIEIEYFGPEPEPIVDYQSGYAPQDAAETRQDEQETACPPVIDSSDQDVDESQNEPLSAEMEEERQTDEMAAVEAPKYALAAQRLKVRTRRPAPAALGMSYDDAEALMAEVRAVHPSLDMRLDPQGDGSYALAIRYGRDERNEAWMRRVDEWRNQGRATQWLIESGLTYAASKAREEVEV